MILNENKLILDQRIVIFCLSTWEKKILSRRLVVKPVSNVNRFIEIGQK